VNRYYPAGVIFHNMILGLPWRGGGSGSATPPGGPDRPGHSRQLQPLDLLSRSCNNITTTLISS